MPKIIEKSISILSDAGLGMAMFSLGQFICSIIGRQTRFGIILIITHLIFGT